jgi:UDP-2,4-diacetamido-2,4,6-trideoxy-beta-L-altropyranose hydrolase
MRVDGGPRIGTGHVMRCLALAQAWQDGGGRVVFVMRGVAGSLRGRLESEGFVVRTIEAEGGEAADVRATTEVAREGRVEWVVIDGYTFSGGYEDAVREAGCRVLAVDDFGQVSGHRADVVLDQNLGTGEGYYKDRAVHTRVLLGESYTMLRREFRRVRGWSREIPVRAKRLLITMGGSDPENVTSEAIRAVGMLGERGLETRVVVGAANSHGAEIEAAVAGCGSAVRVVERAADMSELMRWADVAVSAAGTTCWELAYLGLPSLLLVLADNQRPAARELQKRGVAVDMGWHAGCGVQEIAGVLERLMADAGKRGEMSRVGRLLIDGGGADRVVEVLRVGDSKAKG